MKQSVWSSMLLVLSGFGTACSGSLPPVPLEPPPGIHPSSVSASSAAGASEGQAPASAPESSIEADGGQPSTVVSEPALEVRDVKYVVRSDGLKVLADGVSLVPRARAVRVGAGWGLLISVEVRSEDGATHTLLAPEVHEIALAGEVRRAKKEEVEEFSDVRESDRTLELTPVKMIRLEAKWPRTTGLRPLSTGDELGLEMGLWGLGRDPGSRRPLRRLARVDVSFDGGKPRVRVGVPEGLSN